RAALIDLIPVAIPTGGDALCLQRTEGLREQAAQAKFAENVVADQAPRRYFALLQFDLFRVMPVAKVFFRMQNLFGRDGRMLDRFVERVGAARDKHGGGELRSLLIRKQQ